MVELSGDAADAYASQINDLRTLMESQYQTDAIEVAELSGGILSQLSPFLSQLAETSAGNHAPEEFRLNPADNAVSWLSLSMRRTAARNLFPPGTLPCNLTWRWSQCTNRISTTSQPIARRSAALRYLQHLTN